MTMDYRAPNYTEVIVERGKRLEKIQKDPELLKAMKAHYATHPWDFITDWGVTFEPRNIEKGLITNIPFILWPKQVEFIKWMYDKWQKSERGIVEKSRDCGVTWLCVGFAVSMYCNVDGFTTGFGSRKEELVDKRGDSKSIFEKIRFFVDNLPKVFLPEHYVPRLHSAHMRIVNPDTDAAMIGESGDEIGRGGRTSIYLVDEAAFIERQLTVDSALSQNTNCQIDVSTPNGSGNEFYKKVMKWRKTDRIFVFDWKDDPRKDQAWYDKQVDELDEITVAQEIDRDYTASQADSFIPAKHVAASIDAHQRLGFYGSGVRTTGFDPADTGDAKAVVNRHGSVIKEAVEKNDGSIVDAIPWAYGIADDFRADIFGYDADGMGAPSMKLALPSLNADRIKIIPYHGSAGVTEPGDNIKRRSRKQKRFRDGKTNAHEGVEKTNADTYVNYRAQTWARVATRFRNTFDAIEAVKKGHIVDYNADDLISISSSCKGLTELQAELSRPMRQYTDNGKIKVESKASMKKRQVMSPNLADALVIAMSVTRPPKPKAPPPKYESWGPAVKGVM